VEKFFLVLQKAAVCGQLNHSQSLRLDCDMGAVITQIIELVLAFRASVYLALGNILP